MPVMSRGRRVLAGAVTLAAVVAAGLAGPALAQQGTRKGTAAKAAPKTAPAPVLVAKKRGVKDRAWQEFHDALLETLQ